MKRYLIIAIFAIGSVSACQTNKQSIENPKPDGKKSYKEFEATIKAFPYQAPRPRYDPYLYVRFGTDDRAKHFGPVNIEGLTEKR